MSRLRRSSHEYELLPRSSLDSPSRNGGFFAERPPSSTWLHRLLRRIPGGKQLSKGAGYAQLIAPRRRRRGLSCLLHWIFFTFPCIALVLVVLAAILFPSYSHPPAHYKELRKLALSTTPGRANVHNEKVFIAASIYEREAELSGGPWAQSMLELIDMLGPENVYLSVYENNPDEPSYKALQEFEKKVQCNSTINWEDLPYSSIQRVTLPSGERRIKRIAFLAEVRNRALKPLEELDTNFDRVLIINDINFDPISAAQLLFSTNLSPETGRADYAAACAVDFINPFKFYDRFATRDFDGYSMGIPFYPWFTSTGSSTSRRDVLSQTDAVRVRACWGGMTAFEAQWFLPHTPRKITPATPLRFRYEEDTFWDSSECCLIHADPAYQMTGEGMPDSPRIYMNPFIRVAYDPSTLSWLSWTRRPERLYSFVHNLLNHLARLPEFNPRRTEEPGQTVTDKVWVYNDPKAALSANGTQGKALEGAYQEVERVAGPGGFCGGRKLLLINEEPKRGESKWVNVPIPIPQS